MEIDRDFAIDAISLKRYDLLPASNANGLIYIETFSLINLIFYDKRDRLLITID